MSEQFTPPRKISEKEYDFIVRLFHEAGLSLFFEAQDCEAFPGREYLILKSPSDRGKKVVLSGFYTDWFDGGDIFVDLLIGEEKTEFEVWFWKPMPGTELITVLDWPKFHREPRDGTTVTSTFLERRALDDDD